MKWIVKVVRWNVNVCNVKVFGWRKVNFEELVFDMVCVYVCRKIDLCESDVLFDVGYQATTVLVMSVCSDSGVVWNVRCFGCGCKFGFLYGDDVCSFVICHEYDF